MVAFAREHNAAVVITTGVSTKEIDPGYVGLDVAEEGRGERTFRAFSVRGLGVFLASQCAFRLFLCATKDGKRTVVVHSPALPEPLVVFYAIDEDGFC